MQKEWVIAQKEDSQKPLLERLLAIRGITKTKEIKEFLNDKNIDVIIYGEDGLIYSSLKD